MFFEKDELKQIIQEKGIKITDDFNFFIIRTEKGIR